MKSFALGEYCSNFWYVVHSFLLASLLAFACFILLLPGRDHLFTIVTCCFVPSLDNGHHCSQLKDLWSVNHSTSAIRRYLVEH